MVVTARQRLIEEFLHEAGLAKTGMVGVTQPRRVAAMTVAKRVAQEMGTQLGEGVGYTIRFEDVTSPNTKVKFLTDGMLLREAMLDPMLKSYSVIILDEAHERTLHTDVLFALIKGIMVKRKDLRLVIMSATLEAEKFAEYFRQFPVDVYYADEKEVQPLYLVDYMDAALLTVLQLHLEKPAGDILLFLTGQEEIEHMTKLLEQKARTFGPEAMKARRSFSRFCSSDVILATNIAETSITIPGIKYVIDTGVVKERMYNAKIGIDSLTVVPVSKAAARQRSGRAGRESAGECYRLYREESFLRFAESQVPEIKRANMASVVLQLKALGIQDVTRFDYMDPPPLDSLKKSIELLTVLGALDSENKLTSPIGRNMAALPLDPLLSKTLIMSEKFGCTEEILIIVAMLSGESIFFVPRGDKKKQAELAHRRFHSIEGDHITLLNIYKAYQQATNKNNFCYESFINSRTIKHIQEVWRQLGDYCRQLGIERKSCGENTETIRRCLTSGFFLKAALAKIHPSSVLFTKKPLCVLYNQLVMTKQKYMREVVVIDQNWLVELAPNFYAKRSVVGSHRQGK
ncbi:DEAD/DEAH box helicase [Acanthamoeba castellanii str. Neff]|uniref:RNA helicase n=1 Tax=Acanthamoeba castellanii (strain ATCC 30010 / Neff) TaxID=1257118 RepID=L8GS15_ACACF|nr:DEAD/DEAH box helicase [Acanthamoeba castellanii str. Neff]ELR15775.1 DEAD/DEAH box helicase [Acanthamoeba castellanii str. Neff]